MLVPETFISFGVFITAVVGATEVSYPIPSDVPSIAAKLDAMPVGASFEFFMWPSYMLNITPPLQCIDHISRLYGEKMPIRIGGTTQDRATYNPDMEAYVSYHVDDPLDAPMTLTYGPGFFDLIENFGSETIIGFNRGDDNITNTLEAALMAKSKILDHLWAIELGNEPDLYYSIWKKPIAIPPWNNTQEGNNAAEWAQAFIDAWGEPLPILAAGGYAGPMSIYPEYPSTDYLIEEAYNQSIKEATKTYNTHLYSLPFDDGGYLGENATLSLSIEMNHIKTVSDLSFFVDPIATAKSVNKSYIIGETGFHADDYPMDATFGGAIQILDKTFWALSIGIERLFYHQGTINQAYFNWWSDNQVNAPFYGGYMAALALNGGDHLIASDSGNDSYAQYVVYKEGAPFKALLINTDYYSGIGTRNSTQFTLTGLEGDKAKALRMTASSSETTAGPAQDNLSCASQAPELTIGGQYFSNADCAMLGEKQFEWFHVRSGEVTLTLAASEALLVYL